LEFAGLAKSFEIHRDLFREVGGTRQEPHLDVPLVGGFGEIGGRQKKCRPVHDNNFGMKASPGVRIRLERPRIVIDLGERLPRPVLASKFLRVFENNGLRRGSVPRPARDINMKNDAKLGAKPFLLGQTLERQLAVVKGVTRQNNFVLRLLKKRLDHGERIRGWDAREIGPGNDQIRDQNTIAIAPRHDRAQQESAEFDSNRISKNGGIPATARPMPDSGKPWGPGRHWGFAEEGS
jgi:hypothetical protein